MSDEHVLRAAIEGFETLDVPGPVVKAAADNLREWLEGPQFESYRAAIADQVRRQAWDALLDAFYQVIPFGTGGRRGPVGVGPNRINPWTIATSVQGHAAYLRQRFGDAEQLGVVIAYDVRCFRDRRGVYADHNPLQDLSSRDLAEMAACVYAAAGMRVHIQPRGDDTFLSTPELSYGIRLYGAHAGLNVSASHNHPDDNGGKFYNHLGGQEIPPDDEAMVACVEAVRDVQHMPWDEAVAQGLIVPIGSELHDGYVAHVTGRGQVAEARSAHVVFTPLHGTGVRSVVDVLRAAGFRVTVVDDQATPDGGFPTVPFRAPNPEVPEALERGIDVAREVGADIVMATDPDADRIGAAVVSEGAWRCLTGNEIASLVVDHGLRYGGIERPLVVQTEVTTGFVARMARARGAQVVDHLLVGFKYVGDVLRSVEDTGRFGSLEASLDDFVAGVEESHGILVTTGIRDKDAAGGALYLAEAASLAKDAGRTLGDTLRGLWAAYGYVANTLVSTVMRGAVGRQRIGAIQQSLRDRAPASLLGMEITAVHDRLDPAGVFGPIKSNTDRASRDVLVFELGDQARIILRPSGTEPKNKAYVEVRGRAGAADPEAERARVDRMAVDLAEAFVDEALSRIGLALPAWAHGVSGLVDVDGKLAFAAVMPELVRRIEADEPHEAWLNQQLERLGPDPRGLVRRAVERYLEAAALQATTRSRVEALLFA